MERITSLVTKITKFLYLKPKLLANLSLVSMTLKDSIKNFDGIGSDLVQKWIVDIRWICSLLQRGC